MKLNILVKTSDYRGDHAADISVAIDVEENTSIKDLCQKVHDKFDSNHNRIDCIEIRECEKI
jgi:hypothetical protein